jgi:ribosome-binding factor A
MEQQPSQRQEKISSLLQELASEFIRRESSSTSLITVTKANVSRDLRKSTIFVTVLPDDKQEAAMEFLRRKRSDFRDFVKPRLTTKILPMFDFEIDTGEKHRQRIDEVL